MSTTRRIAPDTGPKSSGYSTPTVLSVLNKDTTVRL